MGILLKSRQAVITGTTVLMQSRNLRLDRPTWCGMWREQYASEKDAKIAAYVWEKRGVALLANEVGEAKKRETAERRNRQSGQEYLRL